MKSIMHEIICSDIRFLELKLKRINLCKEQLLNTAYEVNASNISNGTSLTD